MSQVTLPTEDYNSLVYNTGTKQDKKDQVLNKASNMNNMKILTIFFQARAFLTIK